MVAFETGYGPNTTYCEWLAKTRWGAYIAEIEKRAIMIGHAAAGPPGKALEIGCEGGRWSIMLDDLGWDMTCTDVQSGFLDICRQRLPHARCVLVTPEETTLPCATQSIDLLLCVGVPPAIQSPTFIDEAHRVLKPGGIVVGTFWNLSSPRGYLLHLNARYRGTADYYRIAYGGWRKKLLRRGFQLLHEEGYCWFPFRRASNSSLIPLAVRTETFFGLRHWAAMSPWVAFVVRKLP